MVNLLFTAKTGLSQNISDSTHILPVVDIVASKVDYFSVGLNLETIDSNILNYYKTSSLSGILSDLTSVFVKSYGLGSLATISFRGTSASHTGIFWKGINLNSSSTGITDLSLIPATFFESVSILHGGASSIFGNGNMGGAVHLENNPTFDKLIMFDLETGYGSFEDKRISSNLSISGEKWYSKTSVFFKGVQNNFTYLDKYSPEPEEKKLENAELMQYGVFQDNYLKVDSDKIINLSLWFQKNERHIPPTLTMSESKAWQIDRAFRTAISFTKYYKRSSVNIKSAWFNEYMHYVDDISKIDSKILINRIVSEIEHKRKIFKGFDLNSGISYNFSMADIEAYNGIKDQRVLGLYLMIIKDIGFIPWKINLNLRQDIVRSYKVPFTPALGFEGIIYKNISGKINVSRNFRIPSMNDRYWIPGGNEELKPENSWNEEASLVFNTTNKTQNVNAGITLSVFHSTVSDWIQWIPSEQGYWKPENVMKVSIRGLEIRSKIEFSFGNINGLLNVAYSYTKSTNGSGSNSENNLSGKQLIYVPLNKVNGQLLLRSEYFSIIYAQSYNGLRYTLRDNSESLPSFSTGNLKVSRSFQFAKSSVGLQFEVYNIWNIEYQSIEHRPMPGRSYMLSVKYLFNNKLL